MRRGGAARRSALISLCPPGRAVIDVGADHGHVAAALGGIATERMPHRRGRSDVRWVIADGLSCFRHIDVAVIAGMGAFTIGEILTRGPRPAVLVAHAPDDPGRLRRWLAANGWRIEAERLAPEGRRYAEVLRAVPGVETATGLTLEFGPRLLDQDDPLLRAHLEHTRGHWASIAEQTRDTAEEAHQHAAVRVAFLDRALTDRGWS